MLTPTNFLLENWTIPYRCFSPSTRVEAYSWPWTWRVNPHRWFHSRGEPATAIKNTGGQRSPDRKWGNSKYWLRSVGEVLGPVSNYGSSAKQEAWWGAPGAPRSLNSGEARRLLLCNLPGQIIIRIIITKAMFVSARLCWNWFEISCQNPTESSCYWAIWL